MSSNPIPAGYALHRRIDYTRRGLAFGLGLLSVALTLLPLLLLAFPPVTRQLFLVLDPTTGAATLTLSLRGILWTLGAGLVLIASHEVLHAAAMRLCTREKLRCQVLLWGVTVFCPTASFSRRAYLAMILAPACVLTLLLAVLCFTLPAPYAGAAYFIACIHLGGCAADFYMATVALRAGPAARFVDGGVEVLELQPQS